MFNLPTEELIIFSAAIFLYLLAAVLAMLRISSGGDKYKVIQLHAFSLALIFQTIMLILRARQIHALPMTDVFESVFILAILVGILYLVMGVLIRELWFSTMMIWVTFVIVIISAAIARPAQSAQEIATEPWAIAHALSMLLGAAAILLATVSAIIYLLSNRRLKKKQFQKVRGKMPNLQRLQKINIFSLIIAFVFITLGVISGITGVWLKADVLGASPQRWLIDSKILGICISWVLLLILLLLYKLHLIRQRHIAHATIIAMVWIVFAFIGSQILCNSKHDFSAAAKTGRAQSNQTIKKKP